jgi:hypothetical protein
MPPEGWRRGLKATNVATLLMTLRPISSVACQACWQTALVYPRIVSTDVHDGIGNMKRVVATPGIATYRSTSVAWKRTEGGMVRPRAWAVLRLITNSKVVGCSTGRSPGLAPLRILST